MEVNKMKSFSKWTIEEVEDTFQCILKKKNSLMDNWLNVNRNVSQEEESLLNKLCIKLQERVWDWNEEELKAKFIIPLLCEVDFDSENYQSFFERTIVVDFNNETLSGNIDFLVSQGKRSPKRPFFLINEYKKEHESSNDPLGQLLSAMIAVQKLNDDDKPVYGIYVMGRLWSFVVLHKNEYSVSLAFDATKKEIFDIFCILKNTKNIIEKMILK